MLQDHKTHPSVVEEIDPKDVDAFIQQYDQELMKTPVTYEEHFIHLHYAYTAMVLFNQHIVMPRLNHESEDFRKTYLQCHYKRLHEFHQKLAPLSNIEPPITRINARHIPPTEGHKITLLRAQAMVRDHRILMKHRFVQYPGTGDAVYWKVDSIVLKDIATQDEYHVLFDGCDDALPMHSEEVIQLMMDSKFAV